jgi:UDP-N-acetylglucosamine acyltransferase
VHQFTRVGTLALMQGGSAVSKDVPPFTVSHLNNQICGLNVVGLRRAGFSAEQRQELKRLYHALFRDGRNFRNALAEAREEFFSEPAKMLMEFCATAKRGVTADSGGGNSKKRRIDFDGV